MSLIKKLFGGLTLAMPPVKTSVSPVVLISDNKENYITCAYQLNDILYSVIHIQVEKARVAPWAVYKIVDDEAYKKYKAFQLQVGKSPGAFKAAAKWKQKALEPYTGDETLNNLLTTPNPDQSFGDLIEESLVFKLLTGDKFQYAEMAGGGLNSGKPLFLYNLPSQHMGIKVNQEFPYSVGGYLLNIYKQRDFEKEQILHEKYANPDWSAPGSNLYGQSPLKAAMRRIQRINEAQIAGVAAFQNGGARGILSVDTQSPDMMRALPSTPEQMGAVKDRIDAELGGGSRRNNKTVFFNMPMKYQPIGLSPVDLNILESEQWDFRMICAIYGVPSQLLNDAAASTDNNVGEAVKALTTRCVLPLLTSYRDSLNHKLHTDWGYAKRKDIIVDFDMTVYPELEEDKGKQTEWLERAWWLTPNQKLAIMGESVSDNPLMDQIILPNNRMVLDDLQAPDLTSDTLPIDDYGDNPEAVR